MADGEVRRSELSIASGLYVLRYLAGLDTRSAPSAKVAPTDGSKNDVDVISPPGFGAGELPGPGTSVVVLARQAGKLDIAVTAAEGSSNLDARFTLDMLGAPRPEASSHERSSAGPCRRTQPLAVGPRRPPRRRRGRRGRVGRRPAEAIGDRGCRIPLIGGRPRHRGAVLPRARAGPVVGLGHARRPRRDAAEGQRHDRAAPEARRV